MLSLVYQSYDTDCSVDNIQVDPVTGDLWLGCQPLMKAVMDVYGWLGLPHASQVGFLLFNHNMKLKCRRIYEIDLFKRQRIEEGKDQESIQSSSIP